MSIAEEELLASDYELHRPLHLARCHCCDDDVRPHSTFASKCAANELRHDVHVLFRNGEELGHRILGAEDVLR